MFVVRKLPVLVSVIGGFSAPVLEALESGEDK
jgi:hypothetical protein